MRLKSIVFVLIMTLLICLTKVVQCQVTQTTDGLLDYLYYNAGPKLDCYFVLEDSNDDKTRKQLIGIIIKTPKNALSVNDLVANLRNQLPGFVILVSPNKKIVTIVNQRLENDPNYIMCKKLSLDIDTTPGQLVQKLSMICDGTIANPTLFPSRPSLEMDLTTKVSVHAKNKSIRSILEDYIPLAGYSHIIFRTMTTIGDKGRVTEVFWQGTGYASK